MLTPAIRARLVDGAVALGVKLGDREVSLLARLMDLVLDANREFNLTRITACEDFVDLHLLDSLAVAPLVLPAASIVDVGAGAGFPGIPLAIVRPRARVMLVEATIKKAEFLRRASDDLGLGCEVVALPSDTLRRSRPRRLFDVAVSRAAMPPGRWVKEGAPLVDRGGLLVAMVAQPPHPLPPPPPHFAAPEVVPYRLPRPVARSLLLYRHTA